MWGTRGLWFALNTGTVASWGWLHADGPHLLSTTHGCVFATFQLSRPLLPHSQRPTIATSYNTLCCLPPTPQVLILLFKSLLCLWSISLFPFFPHHATISTPIGLAPELCGVPEPSLLSHATHALPLPGLHPITQLLRHRHSGSGEWQCLTLGIQQKKEVHIHLPHSKSSEWPRQHVSHQTL